MQQLTAAVLDTIRQARRSLDAARLTGDVAQARLQQARLAYMTELAIEYGITVSYPRSPAASR